MKEWCSACIQLKVKKLQLSNDAVSQGVVYLTTNRSSFFVSQKFLFTARSYMTRFYRYRANSCVYVGVLTDFKIYEKYLTLRSLHYSTKRANVFREFYAAFQKAHLDPSKLFSMATDTFPSKLGANQGLQGLINKWRVENNLPCVAWHHCILHQKVSLMSL